MTVLRRDKLWAFSLTEAQDSSTTLEQLLHITLCSSQLSCIHNEHT